MSTATMQTIDAGRTEITVDHEGATTVFNALRADRTWHAYGALSGIAPTRVEAVPGRGAGETRETPITGQTLGELTERLRRSCEEAAARSASTPDPGAIGVTGRSDR
jgi:hypothetical protein